MSLTSDAATLQTRVANLLSDIATVQTDINSAMSGADKRHEAQRLPQQHH
jgi:hypothetical protein